MIGINYHADANPPNLNTDWTDTGSTTLKNVYAHATSTASYQEDVLRPVFFLFSRAFII